MNPVTTVIRFAFSRLATSSAALRERLGHLLLLGHRPRRRLVVLPGGEALIGGVGDLFDPPAAAGEAALVRRVAEREARGVRAAALPPGHARHQRRGGAGREPGPEQVSAGERHATITVISSPRP
jgi:hypothetical protein